MSEKNTRAPTRLVEGVWWKLCKGCGKELPLTAAHWYRQKSRGCRYWSSRCRRCHSARVLAHQKHTAHLRAERLARKEASGPPPGRASQPGASGPPVDSGIDRGAGIECERQCRRCQEWWPLSAEFYACTSRHPCREYDTCCVACRWETRQGTPPMVPEPEGGVS